MRSIKQLCSIFVLALLMVQGANGAEGDMDPRAKVVMMTSSYGTAAGALLGLASMAYGTTGRAIAVGASLGLYAGLLFGGYIVVSHQYATSREPYTGGGSNPLYDDVDIEEEGSGYFRYERIPQRHTKWYSSRPTENIYYLNLLNISF